MTAADIKTSCRVANELDAARRVLNCIHQFPTNPPFGTVLKPGPCRSCGISSDRAEPVEYWVRQSMRDLLSEAAKVARNGTHNDALLAKALVVAYAITGGVS